MEDQRGEKEHQGTWRKILLSFVVVQLAILTRWWLTSGRDGPTEDILEVSRKVEDGLRSFYLTNIKPSPLIPWNEDITLDDFEPLWTRLDIIKETPGTKKIQYIPVYGISDIFAKGQGEQSPLRILLFGEPGIGKSTLVNKIAVDWAEQGQFSTQAIPFRSVFLIRLVAVNPGVNLGGIIKDQLFSPDCGLHEIDILSYLAEFGKEALFILDGFDSYQQESSIVNKIIHAFSLSTKVVLIISRTKKATIPHIDRLIQIRGLDRNAQKLNTEIYFSQGDEDKASEIVRKLDTLIPLQNLVKIPILNAAMCAVYNITRSLPASPAGLLATFLEILYDEINPKPALFSFEEIMQQIGNIALRSLILGSFEFQLNLTNPIINCTTQTGILKLTQTRSNLDQKGLVFGSFIHEIIHQYAAAWYVLHNDDIIFKHYLKGIIDVLNGKYFLEFVIDMTTDSRFTSYEMDKISNARKLFRAVNQLAVREVHRQNGITIGDIVYFANRYHEQSLYSQVWQAVMKSYHPLNISSTGKLWTGQAFYYVAGKHGTMDILKEEISLELTSGKPPQPAVVHIEAEPGTKIGLTAKDGNGDSIEFANPTHPGVTNILRTSRMKIIQLSRVRITRNGFQALTQADVEILCLSQSTIPKVEKISPRSYLNGDMLFWSNVHFQLLLLRYLQLLCLIVLNWNTFT